MAGQKEVAEFERLYGEHCSPVRSFLRVYLHNQGAAEDLTQETFLEVWRRPSGFDPKRSSMRAYLLGIARKKAADWWRRYRPESPPVESARSAPESTLLLTDALAQLEPECRNILWLREVEGYSYDELAALLGIPLGTVKSRLFSAREQLRTIWKDREENQ